MLNAAASCITVPELSARWKVTQETILGHIASGRLDAFNIASKPGGRPCWRIRESAIEAFEAKRSAVPPAPTPRRSRTRTEVTIPDYIG